MSDYTQEFKDQVTSKVSHLQVLVDNQKSLDKQDYIAQMEAWNTYQAALTEIKEAVRQLPGFWLARNISSNLRFLQFTPSDFSNHSVAAIVAVGAEVVAIANYLLTTAELLAIPAVTFGAIEAAMYAMKKKAGGKQQMLKATCKPILHVNELEFAHVLMAGLPKVMKDPDVPLPEMHVEIPRTVLAQESLRVGWKHLQHISLKTQ